MGSFFWGFMFLLSIVFHEISIFTFLAIPFLLMFIHLLKESYEEV